MNTPHLPPPAGDDHHRLTRRSLIAAASSVAIGATVLAKVLPLGPDGRRPIAPRVSDGVLRAFPLESDPSRPTVLVAFQARDCQQSRGDFDRWNGRTDVRVIGALLGTGEVDNGSLKRLLEGSGIQFQVHRPAGRRLERLIRSVGYRATPVLLCFDARERLVAVGSAARLRAEDFVPGHAWDDAA